MLSLVDSQTQSRFSAERTPRRRRELVFEALVRQLEVLSLRRPVLIVFEDAQWSDPTTLELLDMVLRRFIELPVLVLITFRPEFAVPWTGQSQVTTLTLSRLDRRDGAALVRRVVGNDTLADDVVEAIVERTDGVPLFIEELTKAVIESGMPADLGDQYTAANPLSLLAIPATLHGSLLARLDRLAPVRDVAQIGAALGRRFSHELINAVAAMPPPQLDEALEQLVGAELVYRRGVSPDAEYTFKHALVQDAAYQSMLKIRCAYLPSPIPDVFERSFP